MYMTNDGAVHVNGNAVKLITRAKNVESLGEVVQRKERNLESLTEED